MTERLAQSATVTERDAPLISLLWDARMPACLKIPPLHHNHTTTSTPPAPSSLYSSIPVASALPSFHQSSHLFGHKPDFILFPSAQTPNKPSSTYSPVFHLLHHSASPSIHSSLHHHTFFLSVVASIHPSLSFIHPSIHPSFHPVTHLPSIILSIHPSFHLSIPCSIYHPSSLHQSICPSVILSSIVFLLSTLPSIFQSIQSLPSIYHSIHASIIQDIHCSVSYPPSRVPSIHRSSFHPSIVLSSIYSSIHPSINGSSCSIFIFL